MAGETAESAAVDGAGAGSERSAADAAATSLSGGSRTESASRHVTPRRRGLRDERRVRARIGTGAAILVALALLATAVAVSMLHDVGATRDIATGSSGASSVETPAPQVSADARPVFVHVFGAVAEPGLYELREGSRVVDAVAAAGGFADDADRSQANLARLLVDGEQLGIPRQGETLPDSSSAAGTADGAGGTATAGGKVSLNRATSAELQTLPQVGPATAQSIIDWRTQNGPFRSIEDLLSISGIGQKTFDRLKDLVTL